MFPGAGTRYAFVWQMRVCAEMVLLTGICFVFSVTRVVFDLHIGRRWRCPGAASRLLWIVALAASVVGVVDAVPKGGGDLTCGGSCKMQHWAG